MEENNVHLLPARGDQRQQPALRRWVRAGGLPGRAVPAERQAAAGAPASAISAARTPPSREPTASSSRAPRRRGVEVVTRAEVLRLEERAVVVRVSPKPPGAKGRPSEWAAGRLPHARGRRRPGGGRRGLAGAAAALAACRCRCLRLGAGFTCHPAHILVGEHERPITNDVGHPKSYFLDRAQEEGYVLETCMYFPFTTAKNLAGFGADHSRADARLSAAADDPGPGLRPRDSGQPGLHRRAGPAGRALPLHARGDRLHRARHARCRRASSSRPARCGSTPLPRIRRSSRRRDAGRLDELDGRAALQDGHASPSPRRT